MMYFVVILCVVVGTATAADEDFQPGCSFFGGKCVYSIKLGHREKCDTPQTGNPSSGSGDADLTSKYSQLKDDLDKLKTKMNVMSKTISDSSKSKSDFEKDLQKALAARDDIVNILKSRESELSSTKDELSKVMANAAQEIKTLRAALSACQSALGGTGVTTGPGTGTNTEFQSGDYKLIYYNFNGNPGGFSLERSDRGIYLMNKGSSVSTGPRGDHTLGVTEGSYLGINALALASRRYKSSGLFSDRTESDSFPKANGGYCVMFWYYMEGSNVQTLSMNIKIKGGEGYPVFSKTGSAKSNKWELARIDLSNEYTQTEFKVVFVMTSDAYYYSGRNYNTKGDIAVDDLYVYNTSCSNIPRHPGTDSFFGINTTSFYTFHFTPKTWAEAYDVCRREGPWSGLVSIETDAEQKALVKIIRSNAAYNVVGANGFYTSGADHDSEQQFGWTNTGVLRKLKYTNWQIGQPNNVAGNQNCLLMEYPNADFKWGDVNCNTKHPFICESEVPGRVTK